MVGQEHVLRALINALDSDRLHHAFLFTGTRGVGKTTIARILAKSLNCETGVSSTPCGECSACQEIDQGRFVDLIEVDAASRTKVDDTRELLDNVQYAPTRGRYKVYLIDEVHMLSPNSFNALLKTLEEPPPHVKFLFATTDPQKMPVTVLSRCLQFSLKRIPMQMIADHLENVLGQEGIERDESAVNLLARAAEGSMRDALSLMDQAIGFAGGELRDAEVRSMLGTIDRSQLFDVLDAIAAGDGARALEVVADLDTQAPDYKLVAEELAVLLQRLARLQIVPKGTEDWEDLARLSPLAEAMAPEDVQLYYQIVVKSMSDVAAASDGRSAFEMLLLRLLAFRPLVDSGEATAKKAEPVAPVARPANKDSAGGAASETGSAGGSVAPVTDVASAAVEPAPATSVTPPASGGNWKDPDWHGLVDALGMTGVAQQLAMNCVYSHREGNTLHLELAEQHGQLVSGRLQERIEESLSRFYGEKLKIQIDLKEPDGETPAQRDARRQAERLAQAKRSLEVDPTVNELRETFGAALKEDTIAPLD